MQAQRSSRGSIHHHSDAFDPAARVGCRRRHIQQREVPHISIAHLLEVELRAGPRCRNSNRRQQLVGGQNRHPRDVRTGADEEILGLDHTLAPRAPDDHLSVERDERRRGIGRVHRHTAIGVEDGVLPIDGRGRVRIADVAAGPVASPSRPVVPATRILRHVAPERPLVANLRRGDELGGLAQERELPAHLGIPYDLGERRGSPDLEAAVAFLDATQLRDTAQVDDDARALDAIFQPVEGIHSTGHHPRIRAVPIEERDRVNRALRLEELERGHHVVNHSHDVSPSDVRRQGLGSSALPASSEVRIMSSVTGARW